MQLIFEHSQSIGTGAFSDLIHLWDEEANNLNVQEGRLHSQYAYTPYGVWEDLEFLDDVDISIHDNINSFRIDTLGDWGAIGAYKQKSNVPLSIDTHWLLIYEYQQDVSEFLDSGSVSYNIDDPINRFTLSLENPDIKNPEKPGNIAVNEETSILTPGGKVIFNFWAGASSKFRLGQFFIDRYNYNLSQGTATTEGRNTIGKVLGDQTVDEFNEYWFDSISEIIKELLNNANIKNNEFRVANTSEKGWFSFSPNTSFEKGLTSMLETLPHWKIQELSDGIIIVGPHEYAGFTPAGVYTFYRNKDIFSRQITRDDAEAYTRVCVHTENYGNVIFKKVTTYAGWNLKANKTLYVQVANGLKTSDLQTYADELADRLSEAGKVESFTGPIRPHLQCGDEAIIIDSKGSKSLGLITEITHSFGKAGFFTDFTVDSGGTVGKGRLSDYISKIAAGTSGQKAEAGWNDVNMDEYINLCRRAEILTSSEGYRYWPKENMIDGKSSYWEWDAYYEEYWRTDSYWEADIRDANPVIEIKLGQRCLVNKIKLYFGSKRNEDSPIVTNLPKGYRLQFWNNSFWVDLATVTHETSGIGTGYIANPEPIHEFEAIETSAIRLIITPVVDTGLYRSGYIREIEAWGNM